MRVELIQTKRRFGGRKVGARFSASPAEAKILVKLGHAALADEAPKPAPSRPTAPVRAAPRPVAAPPTVAAPVNAAEQALLDMTNRELRDLAGVEGADVSEARNKASLVGAIMSHRGGYLRRDMRAED